MKIAIVGPIATENVAHLLAHDTTTLPQGYYGAPLLASLIEALQARGHEIVAFTTSSDLDPRAEPVVAVGRNFKIYYCPVRKRAFRWERGSWGRATDGFRLERVALGLAIAAERIDVVHAHWTYEFALAALESKLPSVITCHDAPQVVLRHMPSVYRCVRYLMARRVLHQAKHVTAVSPYLQRAVSRYTRAAIEVVPNPIPLALTNQPSRDPPLSILERPSLAMVLNGWGRLKNPKPALRAFAQLRRQYPNATLLLVGKDFGYGDAAYRWCHEHGIASGVRFLGPLTHANVLAELRNVHILVHPSLEESFGMSIAEAMALGVPVVGGSSSGAASWVIGEGGIATDVSSPHAIVASIQMLLKSTSTYADYCMRATNEARQRFRADIVAEAYERFYLAAMRRTQR